MFSVSPQQPHPFIRLPYSSSLFLSSLHFVMLSCRGHICDCVPLWGNMFLLFYLNCPIITLRRVTFLADLSKHKRYEIRLSVYNAVGEGPSSAPQEVFVGEAGMLLYPRVQSSSMTNTLSIRFSSNSSTPKCGGAVVNCNAAGGHVGPSSSGRSERGYTGLQGIND